MSEQKCNKCKKEYDLSHFKNKNDKTLKRCQTCRAKIAIQYKNNKCSHGKRKANCLECDGKNICEHTKQRSLCRLCKGASFCNHGRRRSNCKDCKGGSLCKHERLYSQCVDCKGGTICEHKKRRTVCVRCKGGSICEHKTRRSSCQICEPTGHLTKIVRSQVCKALKTKKTKRSVTYLGCDIDTYKEYLESRFKDGMTWENHGKWHIDHIVPLKHATSEMTIEERLHYKNTQPMWGSENMGKGNRYIG